MSTQIRLNYNDKSYLLEFTRKSAKLIEHNGFNMDEISSKPNIMIPLLMQGALYKNYPKIKEKDALKMFEAQKNRNGLLTTLMEMYAETVNTFFDEDEEEIDEKNSTWEIV